MWHSSSKCKGIPLASAKLDDVSYHWDGALFLPFFQMDE